MTTIPYEYDPATKGFHQIHSHTFGEMDRWLSDSDDGSEAEEEESQQEDEEVEDGMECDPESAAQGKRMEEDGEMDGAEESERMESDDELPEENSHEDNFQYA